jgi:hypothetical protein
MEMEILRLKLNPLRNRATSKKILNFLFAIVVLFIIGYGVYFLSTIFIAKLLIINPNVSAAIIGAMATTIAAVAAVLISNGNAKLREIEETHRPKKVEIYFELLQLFENAIAASNENLNVKVILQQKLLNSIVKLKTNLILWGGPKVIKSLKSFEQASKNGEDVVLAVDNLLRAIRDDIGLSNKGLSEYEIVEMYLNEKVKK